MLQHSEIRMEALRQAIDYHSRQWGSIPQARPTPTPKEIIATAQKFAGFFLVEKKVLASRLRK